MVINWRTLKSLRYVVKQSPLYGKCFRNAFQLEDHILQHYITPNCAKVHWIFRECKWVPYCISYPPENVTDLSFVFWESCPGGGWGEDQGVNGLLARSSDFRVSWSNSRCGIHRLTFPSAAQSIPVLYARTSRTILGLINKVTCLWLTQPLYTFSR
jgi:hypothetical protein